MKNILFVGVLTLGIQTAASGADKAVFEQASSEWSIAGRSPHTRTWERTVYETGPNGETIFQLRRYEEIATGLCYKDEASGEWKDSKSEISILPNGAGATASQGAHKVIFPPDIFDGLIELSTPDSKWLKSRVLGLAYLDSDGRSVLIAETKSSVGVLHGNNVVVYPDAFDGVSASIRYTYTIASFEQDVVIEAQLPPPRAYGLSDNVKVQVLTEFVEAPTPLKVVREENGLRDEHLNFGIMSIGRGTGFALGEEGNRQSGEPVTKSWENMVDSENGGAPRTFLVEEVDYQRIEPKLRELLPRTAMNRKPASPNSALYKVASKRLLPAPRLAKQGTNTFQLAKADVLSKPGYVLDYVTLNSSQTGYSFLGNTTYYISGSLNLYGTNFFEGGSVLKYASNASLNASISAIPLVINWRADAYRPVVFTAKDDNSVGETISGSTGSPTGYYANPALAIAVADSKFPMAYFRIAYAKQALSLTSTGPDLFHGQIVNCLNGITGGGASTALRNLLFANVLTNFNNFGGTAFKAQNVTFSGSAYLATPSGGSSLALTNCILVNVTNLTNGTLSFAGSYNGFYNSPPFGTSTFTNTFYPFQSMCAGNFYLTNGCNFFNAGTTNIDSTLLGDLLKKTTYPPTLLSNITVLTDITLSPQVQRDTDAPELGYHYDPLDYIVDTFVVTNAILTVTNGTAIGYYNKSAGIWLQEGSTIISEGTPLFPNWFAHYTTVQEQPVSIGDVASASALGINAYHPGITGPNGRYRFSKFARPAGGGYHFYHNSTFSYNNLAVQDCEIWNANNYFVGQSNTIATLRNNLFWRSGIFGIGSSLSSVALTNNLFFGSTTLVLRHPGNKVWYAYNNAFDSCTISGASLLTNRYNAYINCSGSLLPTFGNDITLGSFNYTNGPLGSFYQVSTNLVNMGSTTANVVGLYHFTTQTNQVKETNSTVDIGFHYVTTDSSGIPIDTDGDGTPDYWEDANGNGNGGDDATSWQNYNSQNGLGGSLSLQVFTPLKP